jgi:hypothetical protein
VSEYIVSIVVALIAAIGGIGAFVIAWQARREQRRLISAQAGKTEAERNNIEASTITGLRMRIDKLEADARDRMHEMAALYETLMSAIAHNRTLEAERARLLRFLRTRYPDVYKKYCDEYGNGEAENG